ncbi:MAG: hypothetical protein KC466_10400, partial [Myxococcales bacterium]|nr:hypothetical protein [Myxococcales bacterium]
FAVVADEVKKLSQRTNTVTKTVIATIGRIHGDMTQMSASIQETLEREAGIGQYAKKTAAEVIGTVDATTEKFVGLLGSLLDDSREIAKNINDIIFNLQFQDITRQEVEHVIGPLEQMRHEMVRFATAPPMREDEGAPGNEDLLDRVADSYTMECERNTFKEAFNAEEMDGSVEPGGAERFGMGKGGAGEVEKRGAEAAGEVSRLGRRETARPTSKSKPVAMAVGHDVGTIAGGDESEEESFGDNVELF